MSKEIFNWNRIVAEYKENYYDEAWADSDNDGIHEYIESLLPVYYGDIYQVYHSEMGTPLAITVEPHHVGLEFWRIMVQEIFEVYMEKFLEALNELKEEE
tara:strand:- start:2082 stop:2381 length:300 start_codon:yes stop_codon:yes gene_type:complete